MIKSSLIIPVLDLLFKRKNQEQRVFQQSVGQEVSI